MFPRPASALAALALWLGLATPAAAETRDCPAPGQWLSGDGAPVADDALLGAMAQRRVLLLGERHDRPDHHRWQLHTLAGLLALHPKLMIGLEMLPREAQPALDAWVAGELGEAEFLAASHWYRHWGLDPDLYWPILHFARLHRVPLVALNVSRALRHRLSREGWNRVPLAERFGITAPAPASPAYRHELEDSFSEHGFDLDDEAKATFVAAQLVWDRAMASGLAQAAEGDGLVVGLMGSRHLAGGHGVPHQLADLGIPDAAVLLPQDAAAACDPMPRGQADGFFVMATSLDDTAPAPRRLGIRLGPGPYDMVVQAVAADSVAAASGLREGDRLVSAAGRPLDAPGALLALLDDMLPGTALPLVVERDGRRRELLARFPAP
ncbi:ChaN family lipoprotein [Halomonas organivorans]|uniref:Putative iron-regulated protein n=1 Tax=Halomonas organivorans TaxID=257772 RepID=A0A7W5BXG8_9GAMM|nr:ChaN family lipoprotein [Halomonas organivorans]MBB3139948.1 putative iron-regulated protein [Halomonas organivorans]